jgi:hypothetical protein
LVLPWWCLWSLLQLLLALAWRDCTFFHT